MTSSFWAYLPSPMATNSVPADHIKLDVPSPFSRAPSDPLRQLEYIEFPLLSSFLNKSNRFQNLGEMMTLGMNDAAISPSFIEGLTLEGPVGHTARKIAYLIRLPTDEHRLKVGISWLTKSAIDSVASLQTTLTKVLSGS
ncbi:unnamed protein product [Ilex paraguariensis]|uniref:Uncharacterized protein n=1 Tax=Ilex paraguariensis TaxID=185542 RepID=A0ABC8RFC8_9AQUA